MVIDEYFYFDYIAKADTDTLVFPDRLLDDHFNQLPQFPRNVRVYGGYQRTKSYFGELLGPIYNQGLFYWMSVDLARFITSPECDRDRLKVYSEDKSIGNFVHSHPLPIHRVRLSPDSFEHPVKDVEDFSLRWSKQMKSAKN